MNKIAWVIVNDKEETVWRVGEVLFSRSITEIEDTTDFIKLWSNDKLLVKIPMTAILVIVYETD